MSMTPSRGGKRTIRRLTARWAAPGLRFNARLARFDDSAIHAIATSPRIERLVGARDLNQKIDHHPYFLGQKLGGRVNDRHRAPRNAVRLEELDERSRREVLPEEPPVRARDTEAEQRRFAQGVAFAHDE